MTEKKKKFKGTNAQLANGTRLTNRQMKKMSAAYFNVQRDFNIRLDEEQKNAARTTEDIHPAEFGDLA